MLSMESAYEELFENVLCGIIQICLPLKEEVVIYKINPKAESFLNSFGKGTGEACIKISNYMDGDNRKYARAIFSRLKKCGDRQPFLLQLYNGVVEGFAEYILTPDEQPVIQVFFLELSEEIAIRKREAAQKELLESVLQSVRCGVVRYGYSGDEESITLANAAGWRMLGFASEEQCIEQGMNGFLERVHPDDRHTFLRAYYTLNGEMEKKRCEFRIQKQEKWKWLSTELQSLRDTRGNRIVQMTLMDITAQKKLEQKEKAESSEIIHSLGTIYQFIAYLDVKQDRYRVVKQEKKNSRIQLSGEYSEDLKMIYHTVQIQEGSEFQSQMGIEHLCEYYQSKGSFFELEFQICTQKKEKRYYHMEAVLSGDAEGLQHVTIGLRDVTEQRLQELKEHETLQSAYRAETLANRAKTEFLSRMSHDIRTPMNAIVGLSQLMRADLENPQKIKEYLGQMDTASSLLLGLINDVLDMSRIESGQVKVSEQPFYLDDLLGQIETLVASQMNEHHHHFSTEFSFESREYVGDAVHLQQILTNLLSNAIKFTPDKGKIKLRVWSETAKSGVHFEVSDNGMGMSEEFLQRIYQPFEREAEVSNIQGSGLGMAIVGSLVHLMNGWIEIKSQPGQGSCFHIMLPLQAVGVASEVKVTEEELSESVPDLHGKRILVVDDHEVNRMIASKLLRNMGAEVEEAADGVQALTQFRQNPAGWYQLIFMDIRMPNMNGYDAAKEIRTMERPDGAEIPIVAMTANAFAEDVHNALQAGMNAHLAKPIQMRELYQILRKWLGDSGSGQGGK